jgi:hypothetical protein
LSGSALDSIGSFRYDGINQWCIWADPAGKHLSRVFAVNNVIRGSEYVSSPSDSGIPLAPLGERRAYVSRVRATFILFRRLSAQRQLILPSGLQIFGASAADASFLWVP